MRKTLTFCLVLASLLSFSQGRKAITLEDIYKNRKFSSKGFSGIVSMKDGDHYCQLKKDSLNVYEYATGNLVSTLVTAKNLVPAGDTTPIDMSSFEFSADETKILFANDEEPIYRHSVKASYFIYDIGIKQLYALSMNGKQRLATFSPDGRMVAFVRDNNIFVKKIEVTDERASNTQEIQITNDGKQNEIINGAPDWVYEEEFEFTKAFEWSADSKKIAYYRFDESKVKEYQLTEYGDLYPEQFRYKYPKPGESNSVISLFIYKLENDRTMDIFLGKEKDIYIPRIKWTEDPNILSFYRMNRHQNKLEMFFADAATGDVRPVYTEENKYYVEVNDHLFFLKDNKGFVLSSEKSGFRQVYWYDMKGALVKQLTNDKGEVVEVYGLDGKDEKLLYTATGGIATDKYVYSVSLKDGKVNQLTPKAGTNVPLFSKGFHYFVNRWSDINTPPVITVNKTDGEEVRKVQENAKLRETLVEYNFAKVSFIKIRTGDNTELNAWVLKPPDFDSLKKYPVLFTIYGGPGVQTVTNAWGAASSWNQLWAQHGIIVVSVDNRGTGGRGEAFKKMTYLQLGKYETLDQIEAAKYFGSLPYVDKSRIGMWGWSFGGYLTLSCLTKGADYFSFGIAVAPVTNWKYYDNIYTERFMQTPQENKEGYESNSPINHADLLKGKLLIVHGMSDDNVHPQNTYDFVTALVGANKQFEMQVYPNSNHGIYTGKNTSFHLYNRMTEFILRNL